MLPLRCDIVSATDYNGNIYAQYNYDPWDNHIALFGSLFLSHRGMPGTSKARRRNRLGFLIHILVSTLRLDYATLVLPHIVVLENETIFDSRKFREMGNIGKLMGDQFLSLLSYVAEQERRKIKQRQMEGKAVARVNGKRLGRPGCVVPVDFGEKCQGLEGGENYGGGSYATGGDEKDELL